MIDARKNGREEIAQLARDTRSAMIGAKIATEAEA